MILNLPEVFPLDKLEEFTFGDVDGKNDELLLNPFCICNINATNEFLKGKKSLIVGERGSGKTALFTLVSNKTLQFQLHKGEESLIIPIDEDLQYKALKEKIISLIQTQIKDEATIFRFVWELFIIYRILLKLKDEFTHNLPDDLKKAFNEFEEIFGKGKTHSIYDVLASQKKTIGVKLDSSPQGIPVPNFYISVEPKDSKPTNIHEEAVSTINVDNYKKVVQGFLDKESIVLFVLIDKLDDFVIKEEYEIQKLMIQGLLSCERSYHGYDRIRLKIFLRSDLFSKLDFEELGYDKVVSRKIDLIWNNGDIRRFMARRIAYNLMKIMKLDVLCFNVDEEKLYVDENSIDTLSYEEEKKDNLNKLVNYLIKKIKNAFNSVRYGLVKNNTKDERKGKHITFMDDVSRQTITTLFPRNVKHKDTNGKEKDINIFEFIESHFCLNAGHTTPRIIVMFVEKCLEKSRMYYQDNPLDKVLLDGNKEYPLIKRKIAMEGYAEFREVICDTFSKISSKWENWFNIFRANKGNKYSFTYKEIKKLLPESDETELNQFLAFLNHIGYLRCHNPHISHSDRTYISPVLFR